MKTIKCISIFVIAVCILSVTVGAAMFRDVDEGGEAAEAIYKMQEKGYIQGFEDGTFRPNNPLSRAEFVTIINKMYGYTVSAENIFEDVSSDKWYYNEVLVGVQAGYIKGMGDGTFRPDDKVSREQVCVMLNSILKTERLPYDGKITDKISEWARESVEKLLSNRLFSLEEGGRFRATQPITRGESCVALAKCIVEVDDSFTAVDVDEMAWEELKKRLLNIVDVMEKEVIPACDGDDIRNVAVMITDNMRAYAQNPAHDYKAGTKATYKAYEKVDKERRKELRSLIYKSVDTDDLILFYEIFYDSDLDNIKH